MRYFTIRHLTCSLNGLAFQVAAKYILPIEGKGDAQLAGTDCEVGKGEFKGMSCPVLHKTEECPFMNTIPKFLPYPY